MKTLLIAAEKGGTGKSALLCQLAHYLRRVRGARVLVLDLAEPACSTASLTRTAQAVMPGGERVPVKPHTQTCRARAPRIQVLPARTVHGLPSEAGESSARYYANMRHLLRVVAPFVDVCLIDCPPLPDPRAVCAEANAHAMLSPIVLSRETFDSTHDLINGPHGVRNVRARLNPALRFLGLLPNMVEDTPLQRAQARALQAQMGAWLYRIPTTPMAFFGCPAWMRLHRHRPQGCRYSISPGATRQHAPHGARCATALMRSRFGWTALQRAGRAPARRVNLLLTLVQRRWPMCNVSLRSWASRLMRCLSPGLACFIGTSVITPSLAHADDWGCQVILCLSNPGGPEQYAECLPPIEKLWRALRHGDPFPTCDFGAGGSQGTSASNTFASAAYCRGDLLYWGGPEKSELLCGARGAINVDIDGELYTRVWWDADGEDHTITEFYGAGSTDAPYDPMQSARLFLERMQREDGGEADEAGGR